MYRTLTRKFSVVAISILFSFGFAATQSGGTSDEMLYDFWLNSKDGLLTETGLETADYRNLPILIENMSEGAKDIGLTKNAVKTRVELRLLESNLRPMETSGLRPYFYVQVTVTGSGYSINVALSRMVYFDAPPAFYGLIGQTWTRGSAGIHGGDSAYVLSSLDGLLDIFLRDYLMANTGQN